MTSMTSPIDSGGSRSASLAYNFSGLVMSLKPRFLRVVKASLTSCSYSGDSPPTREYRRRRVNAAVSSSEPLESGSNEVARVDDNDPCLPFEDDAVLPILEDK